MIIPNTQANNKPTFDGKKALQNTKITATISGMGRDCPNGIKLKNRPSVNELYIKFLLGVLPNKLGVFIKIQFPRLK